MSIEFHDELNPKLWLNNKLKYPVFSKLKQIAKAFIEFLEIPKNAVKDIVITGSSASYNYTPYSDIDLHIIVDPERVHEDCPLVKGYLLSKKSEFNQKHDIYIYGIPVEVYAELATDTNIHNGLYSIKYRKWVEEPKKIKPPKNDTAVEAKYKEFKEAADEMKEGDLARKLLDKIKKMRKAGLAKAGEFSVENLVFKKLRNEGIIGKLMDIKKEKVDKELSLEEAYESLISYIGEMINTTTSVMAPYPVDAIGRPAPFGKIKKSKKSRGEKRAPHTELTEEYKKESKGCSEKAAMYKYGYKKNGPLRRIASEIADTCEAIIRESKEELQNKFVNKINTELANVKASRRNAQKLEKGARAALHKLEKDKESISYPIGSLVLKDDIRQAVNKKHAAIDKVQELINKRKKIS